MNQESQNESVDTSLRSTVSEGVNRLLNETDGGSNVSEEDQEKVHNQERLPDPQYEDHKKLLDQEEQKDQKEIKEREQENQKEQVEEAQGDDLDLKFKSITGELLVIPEEFKPLIKTKEDVEKVSDYLQKAHSFDDIAQTALSYDKQIKDYQKKITELSQHQTIKQKAEEHRAAQRLDLAFKELGISDEEVIARAEELQAIASLDPAQRADYENRARLRDQALELQNKEQTTSQKLDDLNKQVNSQQEMFLYQSIAADINSQGLGHIAEEYDKRMNDPGAFVKDAVVLSEKRAMQTGQQLTPNAIVSTFLKSLNIDPKAIESSKEASASVKQKEKATLPKANASKSSVINDGHPKSISDIRAFVKRKADEMYASN